MGACASGGTELPVAGRLDAVFDADGARVERTAVLELRGPFCRPGRLDLHYLRHTTCGLLAGDALAVSIEARQGARVQVASASALKVYAMPSSCASSSVQLATHDGATLVWGPHVTLMQRDADLRQQAVYRADAASALIAIEVLALGRLAAGERNAFRRLESSLAVLDAGGSPAFEERYVVEPDAAFAASLGGRGVLVSLLALGAAARSLEAQRFVSACDDRVWAGASRLPNEAGVVVRGLASSVSEALSFCNAALTQCLPSLDSKRPGR